MPIQCRSPYQAEITFKDGKVHVVGPLSLIRQMNRMHEEFGTDPALWPPLKTLETADDLLVNEFILKIKSQFKIVYEHIELCHCRMVPTEKVYEAIKQGCQNVEAIGRTTLAGTGCGSCREDIQKLLNQFRLS